MTRHILWLGVLAATVSTAALAQEEVTSQEEIARGQTVTSRPRPDYDPIGQRVGGFILYPDLQVQEAYDSNIFATPNKEKGDLITSIEPALDLRSNWNVHALNVHLDSSVNKHLDHDEENFTDLTAETGGRLDIYHDARMFGSVGYKLRHEPRSSPNDLGGANPTEFVDYSGSLAGEKEFNRLSFRLDGNVDVFNFSNQRARAGSALSEERRNYTQKRLQLRTGYELAPLRQVFLLTGYDTRDYDFTPDITGFDRNSDGFTVALGANYDITGILFAEAFAGYRQQDYKDSRLASATGPTGGLKLIWNVTQLTTITGSIKRDVVETIVVDSAGRGASSIFSTQEDLHADHELLRNLLLNARIGAKQDDFQGIDRNDDYYFTGVGAKYFINHNFWLSGGYDFLTRRSNVTGGTFFDNSVFVRISAHL